MTKGHGAPRTVIVADDHPVVRLGVRMILAAAPVFSVVGEAGDGDEAIRLVRERRPDLLLLDLSMPKLPGLDALRALADNLGTLRTVILTATIQPQQILEALQLGARAIVLKDAVADHLVAALEAVVGGRYWLGGRPVDDLVAAVRELGRATGTTDRAFNLTPREREVVAAVVEGCTNKEMAGKLAISEETVKRHLTNIFDKTGVSTRLELALFAVHHRL